jgi:uncharacterized protein YbjT (DUF2867 family)
MADKRTIVVMGATGAQGGGLARAILRDIAGPFTVRAVTRNPGSDKARALADLGAEVIAADADDPKSLDAAFAGAYGAYCVTNYWEHYSTEREGAQARAMAEASKRAGLLHVVWSTLEDTRKLVPLSDNRMPTLQDKYKVPHFDSKGESDHFFTDLSVPTTFSLPSFYWENLIFFGSGRSRVRMARSPSPFPSATRGWRASGRRTSANASSACSSGATSTSGRASGSRASTSRAPRWPPSSPKPWAGKSDTTA